MQKVICVTRVIIFYALLVHIHFFEEKKLIYLTHLPLFLSFFLDEYIFLLILKNVMVLVSETSDWGVGIESA